VDSIAGELDASKLYGVATIQQMTTTGQTLANRLAVYDDPEFPVHAAFAVEAGGGGLFYMGDGFGATDVAAGRVGAGVFGAALGVLRANELGGSGQDSAYHRSRTNHTGTQNVSTLIPGADNGVLYVNTGVPTWGLLMDASIASGAAIGWSKISKTGSSLADLSTRSAGDLSTGNIAYARLPTGSGTWDVGSGNTLTMARLTQFSLGVGIGTTPSAAIGLRVANVGQTGASQQSFNTDFTCGTDATTAAMGVLSRVRTPAAAMTCARASALYAGQPVVGAGSTITEAVGLLVEGMSTGATNYAIRTLGSTRSLFGGAVEIDGDLDHDGAALGVLGSAPVAKQTVTGSRAGNAALASLLTALAAFGFITDSSTA
jgi:hypothetical protein